MYVVRSLVLLASPYSWGAVLRGPQMPFCSTSISIWEHHCSCTVGCSGLQPFETNTNVVCCVERWVRGIAFFAAGVPLVVGTDSAADAVSWMESFRAFPNSAKETRAAAEDLVLSILPGSAASAMGTLCSLVTLPAVQMGEYLSSRAAVRLWDGCLKLLPTACLAWAGVGEGVAKAPQLATLPLQAYPSGMLQSQEQLRCVLHLIPCHCVYCLGLGTHGFSLLGCACFPPICCLLCCQTALRETSRGSRQQHQPFGGPWERKLQYSIDERKKL